MVAGSTKQSPATFDRVERTSVVDQVRFQLISSIRSGHLGPGERLPPERQLCDQFGVARTTIREAVKQLESLGILERLNNRLQVVDHLGVVEVPVTGAKKAVRELFETRRVTEISITELAACRATEIQRGLLRELSEAFKPGMELGEFRQLDHRFHDAVAGSCGNPLLSELYGRVLDALFTSPAFASLLHAEANRKEVNEIIEESSCAHREIARAIIGGDAVKAAAAAEAHLSQVEERMLGRLVGGPV